MIGCRVLGTSLFDGLIENECVMTITLIRWGSSRFADRRNCGKFCRRIPNSGNFATEQRNSSSLPGADFLENDALNFDNFYGLAKFFTSYLVIRKRSHLDFPVSSINPSYPSGAEVWLKITGTADLI